MLSGSAVVTGAAKGIGAAIALALIDSGVHVVGVDLDDKALTNFKSDFFSGVSGDVADYDVLQHAGNVAAQHGPLKVWVNNAGYDIKGDAGSIGIEQARRGVDVILLGTLWGTRVALGHMAEGGGGSVISISSVQAVRSFPSMAVYAMCKAGIEGLTTQASVDFARKGVRINAIAPGAIRTGIDPDTDYSDPDMVQSVVDRISPIDRLGQPEDIAQAVLYLADDERSGYVTGTVLTVDGGLKAANPGWSTKS